ncbi:hypothetical protein [Mucilaginibacter sp.]
MTTDNDIYDPLGIEIFAIDETFDSMFNALKGVYARLYIKESHRPEATRNKESEDAFLARSHEIGQLKRSFKHNDWLGKRDAVKQYSPELKRMIALELSEYATLK